MRHLCRYGGIRFNSRLFPSILLGSLIFAFCGCGGGGSSGGGGGSGGGGSSSPDFTLAFNPSSLSVQAGSSGTTSLSATGVSGFSSSISVQVTGLPAGVTLAPSTIAVTPGTPVSLTVNTAANATIGSASVTFSGTSGTLQHNATLSLSVTQGSSSNITATRTKYLRTDAVTEYYLSVNSHWLVYNAPTSYFFVTDPFSNQVFVINATTKTKVASIPVPGAYGIDQTPDGSTLYVGTLIGDVYAIDPVKMQVTQRYLSSEIGPYGYQAIIALVLSDGRLALLGDQGGIPSVDGSASVAIWSPTSNAITIYGQGPYQAPSSSLCGSTLGLHIFGFGLTSDRTALLTGTGNSLCELNAQTGQSQAAAPLGNSGTIITSPDGKYIALPITGAGIELLDQKTLNEVAQLNISPGPNSTVLFSPDSQYLYVANSGFVNVYSVATQQLVGWTPNIVVQYTSGGLAVGPITGPNFGAFDATGLMVGPLEEGIGFIDTTVLNTGPQGQGLSNAYLNPATGPVGGGTVTQWAAPTPSLVKFGSNAASIGASSSSLISVTSPPGNPGPVDVYLFTSSGDMQLIADGFSYGPAILEVSPNISTAEGGGTGVIYGYGFGPTDATSIPSGLSVSVGGQNAPISGFNPNTYNLASPPFLLQSIYYTIPPGTSGNSVSVSVTTGSGTATTQGAMTYLPALKTYPLAGASLAQGVYDPGKNLYYFTDTNKIQVFSLSQGAWLSPLSIPAPAGATQRLWGISLSPDGTKLAVADAQAGVVYLLNPANPSSVQTFPFTPPEAVSGIVVVPAGVAVSNSGIVYVAADVQGGTGFHNFFVFNTNTGVITDLGIDGPGLGASDLNLRLALSADNTRAFFNDDGLVFSVDTATNNVAYASSNPGCCYGDYDLTLAPNQTQLEATSTLYDSNLNGAATFTLNDREIEDTSYVYGTKFSPDGGLLFQPAAQGMDIYDGRLGILRERLAVSVPLSANYDALVTDGKDNVLIAITGANGSGIAVLDLTSVSEPPPLSYTAESPELMKRATARNEARSTGLKNRVPHVTNSAPAQ